MRTIRDLINRFPSVLLLFFVFFLLIPRNLSYDSAWVNPEMKYIETTALSLGSHLQIKDMRVGLNYMGFENCVPRVTRPLSSYFQILDTKFRCWLWTYLLPHPSLSLTWVFTLILGPFIFYRLLRNLEISANLAITMTSFYLMTPAVMSFLTLYFRSSKPMANFVIILCLYVASSLQKKYLQQGKVVPWGRYICFWGLSALSFYWDETALLIFPTILFIFPKVLTHRRAYLGLWLLLPFITAFIYFYFIPHLTALAGYGEVHLNQYDLYKKGSEIQRVFSDNIFMTLPYNIKNFVLGSMGILIPDVLQASIGIKLSFFAAIAGWFLLMVYIRNVVVWEGLVLLLILLLFIINYLMSLAWPIWGPYWYGGFWSIFFTIFLAKCMSKANLNKWFLVVCFIFILLNMQNSFSIINGVYKKYHYYPYEPGMIYDYFRGDRRFFEKDFMPTYSGKFIQENIQTYWTAHKRGSASTEFHRLPTELFWMVLELNPDVKSLFNFQLDARYKKQYIDIPLSLQLGTEGKH